MTFKQNDLKAMRSKSLVTEIETIYDEVICVEGIICVASVIRPGVCERTLFHRIIFVAILCRNKNKLPKEMEIQVDHI